jgi:hypothetical protein
VDGLYGIGKGAFYPSYSFFSKVPEVDLGSVREREMERKRADSIFKKRPC